MTLSQQDGLHQPSPTTEERQLPSTTSPNGGLRGIIDKIQLPPVIQAALDLQKKGEWVAWANTEYTKCKNARLPFERQWYINLAFTAGRQYIAPINVPGAGFRLTAPKAPPWRVRLVINKIRTAVRTECSKLTSNRPIPVVIPATNEDEDYSAARLAERILKSEFATVDFSKVVDDWVWWGVTTGNSFLKSWWDPNAIDELAQPPGATPEEIQQMYMMGQPYMPPEPVKGKICYEYINPFFIYVPDLLSTDIENQPYIFHVSTKTPLWVKNNFGIDASPDARATNHILEAAVLSPMNTSNQHYDTCLVKEVWIKPFGHKDFPEGGVLTIINDKIVQHIPKWPSPFKEYPFYKYNGMPTGGFYTESVVTDLIPIQKEYNRTKSQMIEIKNTIGKPKLLYPKGSVNPRQISSEPGQGIPYLPGFGDKPTVMPAAEVPMTMQTELDRLTSDFDDISGQHEITRGNTPAQVTSGTAINFLQEQDDSKLAYQVRSIEHCTQKLGTHYLKYAAKYWEEGRIIRIVGKDNAAEAKHWKTNDLRGNTDVRIQTGSALPTSKAALSAQLTEFMQNGWVQPQDGLEMIGLMGYEKVIEDFLVDKRQAQRENMLMAEADPQMMSQLVEAPVGADGQPVMKTDPVTGQQSAIDPISGEPWQPQPPIPANSYDNHQAHIHYHNQFRKTQQFELLDESIKKAFELHVQAHQFAMQGMMVGPNGIPLNQNPGQNPEEQGAAEPAPNPQAAPPQQ